MSLGSSYRIFVQNNSGLTLAIGAVTVRRRAWNWGSPATGVVAYEGSATSIYSNSATIANAATDSSADVNNLTAPLISGELEISVTVPSGSPNGTVQVWLQNSVDGTTWPDSTNYLGRLLFGFFFTVSASTARNVVSDI